MGSWQPPPAPRQVAQSRLLLCRRWSTPGPSGPPSSQFYTHYVNGVNNNEAEMREHRKQLYQMGDGKSRTRLRAAYEGATHVDATAAMILAWSREKYKGWARRQPRELTEEGEFQSDSIEVTTPASNVTRKTTVSRMSGRSRESVVRVRSQSSLSPSESEDEKPKNIRTFWWYCGVIKALCKLGLDMQRLSMRKTEQTTLSEMYYVSVGGTSAGQDEDNQILFFDKTLFTRKRAACRVPEWAQNLMILRPEVRRPEEVHRLKNLLMSMRSFREKYTDDMRTKICQVVRYTRCDKGRVVLRQGHLGLYFYFIFSGSVFIQIDLYDPRTGQTTPSTENIIRTGDSFGEIALLGDGLRSATVICREPTELCQIDKSTFLHICPDIFHQQLEEKIAFAKKFELFHKWELESVRQLCFVSQVLYVPHGRVLELDWSTAQYVYFVMSGRLSMIKEFEMGDEAGSGLDGSREGADWDWEEELRLEQEEERYNLPISRLHGAQHRHMLMQRGTPTDKRFACVGTLRDGQTTDLRILSLNPVKIPPITLLSEGVRVLRIATRNFSRFAPKRQVEDYLKRRYTPMVIPDGKAIIRRYLRDMSWRTYRKCVMGTLERAQAGHLLSTLPASSKGTTGWARWPGFDSAAQDKAVLLSERGGRSEIDEFPIVTLPPAYERLRRRKVVRKGPPKTADYRRSLTNASSASVTSRHEESGLVNDRRLVMYPPRKMTAAFLRRRQIES
ncbi:hypothetical protein ACOMHN_026429 [Nucella lapillus]